MSLNLIEAFYNEVQARNVGWIAKGFIFEDGTVYSINHDTKLLGRIFEMLTEPILQSIADKENYHLETPEKQNFYPDFILIPNNGARDQKIAIDVKTTYRDYDDAGCLKKFSFTLGSYTSFLRNETKNIQYAYSEYIKHYVIGFIYDRNEGVSSPKPYSTAALIDVPSPYSNVDFFIQEKHKIAGFGTGSGNTENIGTIKSSEITDFKNGCGPFATMGNEVFEFYWRNYPRYRAPEKAYTNFETFFNWLVTHEDDVPQDILASVHDYAESIDSNRFEVDEDN